MSDANGSSEQWIPVHEAAALANVPVRSAYNWIRAKRVPSRTEGGVVLVNVDDIRGLAATRARPNGGARAGNGAATTSLAQADGDLAARVFEQLESGLSPTEIVKRERLSPQLVRSIHREFVALRDLGGTSKPPLEATVQELNSTFEAFREGLAMDLSQLDDHRRRDSERLDMVIRWLDEIPVPARDEFQCQHCKVSGYPEVYVRCGGCGHQTTWGYRR